jgi:carboxyl-terminal processing protease
VEPFRGGPARRAGALPGDRIVSVDGVATARKRLRQVVEMLRGAEGTAVTVVVRQPMAEERTLKITRDVVPLDTIFGAHRTKGGAWNYRTKPNEPIAYLRIPELRASTLHELRRLEERLRDERCSALILDLRFSRGGDLLQAVFLADAFLAGGRIGSVCDVNGTREFEADADCLFRDWPMAVLVGPGTSGESEWLAAALQDTGRAVLVGEPTLGQGYATQLVELPDGLGALDRIRVAMLRRANGHSLARPALPVPRQRGEFAPLHEAPSAHRRSAQGLSPDHVVLSRARRIDLVEIRQLTAQAGAAAHVDGPLTKAREILTAALAEHTERQRVDASNPKTD